MFLLPISFDDVVGTPIVLVRKKREQFVRGPAFIKRLDQRLNDGYGAVVRARRRPYPR